MQSSLLMFFRADWVKNFISAFLFSGHDRGVQSRSRAVLAYPASRSEPCPKKLYESRPCHAKNCYTFQWNYSKWDMKRRSVWCERSDSLRVTGKVDKIVVMTSTGLLIKQRLLQSNEISNLVFFLVYWIDMI